MLICDNLFDKNNKVTYDEETGIWKDSAGRVIIANPNRYYTYSGSATPVDVTASVDAAIVDVDVNNALANANGSTGVDFAVNKNADGSMNADQHYTSQNVSVNSSGNVIVGSAIGVAAKSHVCCGGNEFVQLQRSHQRTALKSL